MPKRDPNNSEKVCQEHSGLKTMIYCVLAGVVLEIGLLSYNTFGATANIRADIGEIKGNMAAVIKANEKLEARVACLEKIVFKK